MGLFGDVDVASASDDPFKVPSGVYQAILSDVEVKPTNDKSKVGMTLIFTLEGNEGDEAEHNGKQVREWKEIPTPADPKNLSPDDKRAMSFLKSRLLDLGIPEDRVNSVEPDDLKGKEVTIQVKEKGEFTNINKVTLLQSGAATATSGKKKFA